MATALDVPFISAGLCSELWMTESLDTSLFVRVSPSGNDAVDVITATIKYFKFVFNLIFSTADSFGFSFGRHASFNGIS